MQSVQHAVARISTGTIIEARRPAARRRPDDVFRGCSACIVAKLRLMVNRRVQGWCFLATVLPSLRSSRTRGSKWKHRSKMSRGRRRLPLASMRNFSTTWGSGKKGAMPRNRAATRSRAKGRRSSQCTDAFLEQCPDQIVRQECLGISIIWVTWTAVSSMDLPSVLRMGILYFMKIASAWLSSWAQVVILA